MTRSITPDFSTFEVPMDTWSEPFWQAGARGETHMPRCLACGTFRWPAGPFCPECHTQPVEWVAAGQARLYSFTILPVRGAEPDAPPAWRIPALVEFDAAPGVRLVSVLVDADPAHVAIGDRVEVVWQPAASASVPLFRREDAE
ncbi:hypothetical protein EDF56_102135 [Novosphingobium sp. PhB165]|uniref:Zn-ribbon domain-containing OB-fold protein n=1 Tax=Novosphingobium sp. PhB165 TaxID=2485105 RepID=UPI00104E41FD|nr:OB-fold domain-containing protein [Novosphingobium sp. PhB165]TCM20474.1 hypothetical protein EDF56_102135 [Novosphingobium sp. PhB165]